MRARDLVRSAPSGGTVETACVHRHEARPLADTGPAGCRGARPTRTMVLVVGDDPAAQGSLAEVLVRAGYGLMQTTTGRDVLRLAQHYRPDVILLNLTPGRTSTLDELRPLQADAQARQIPIIVLSASDWPPPLTPEANGTRVIFHTPVKPRRLLAHLAQLVGETPVPGATGQEPRPAQKNVSFPVAASSPVSASGDRRRRSPGRCWVAGAARWIVAGAAWLLARSSVCWRSALDVSICLLARTSWCLADSTRKYALPWRFCSILQSLTTHFLVRRRSGTLVDSEVPLGLDG